jgi:hypothetical protein
VKAETISAQFGCPAQYDPAPFSADRRRLGPAGPSSDRTPCPPTNEALQGFQLGPLRIFEGGFGGEDLLQGQPFELADLILIERADPQVADALAFGRFARPPKLRPAICNALLGSV